MYRFLVELLDPYLILAVLTGLAILALWVRRRESRWWLSLVTIPFVLLWVLSTPAAAYLALGTLEWDYPPTYDRPDDAQSIVVLSGYVRPPDDVRTEPQLGEDTLYRCLHAARLYRAGPPCPVVVSGGKAAGWEAGPTLAEAMRDALIELGVPREQILLEDQSQNTHENARQTAVLLKEQGISRVVLVTDATHLKRAVPCFRAEGITAIPSGSYYRATRWSWRPTQFVPRPSAAEDMQRVLHEWVGMAWYRMRGWL
jgi:uncharacterized SAM-binding protein YcdF (DUF218 family)